MQTIDVTFRGMTPSASVQAEIERKTDRLARNFGRISRCSIIVEQPHLHRERGNHFHVRLDVSVPGREIAVSHEAARDADVYVAVAGAFRAARRQLQDYARIRRGDVKAHVRMTANGPRAVAERV